MTYSPQLRYPNGIDPQIRKLSPICDVCGKHRAKFKHDKCSKIRQAAGFRYREGCPEGDRNLLYKGIPRG